MSSAKAFISKVLRDEAFRTQLQHELGENELTFQRAGELAAAHGYHFTAHNMTTLVQQDPLMVKQLQDFMRKPPTQ